MKKIFTSLPFILLVSVVIGILVGLVANEAVMNVVVTIKYVLGQLITFCVPLIIIGFIAPSITKLGKNVSRILGVAVLLAYVSSIGAAFFSMFSGYAISQPRCTSVEGLKELPEVVFQLDIPQIMPVMSALVLSVLLGLACVWAKADSIAHLLDEFQRIVLSIVTRIVIPLLPVFIATTFCALAYEGTITKQLPVFLIVVLIVIVGHYIWLAVLYGIAGAYAGKNPLKVIRHYGPAYLTAVGTMSSAATLAVALQCANKAVPPLRRDMVSFGIPLFANIHLCGSVLTEVVCVMTISQMLYGAAHGHQILFYLLRACSPSARQAFPAARLYRRPYHRRVADATGGAD
ncbi:MAG: cation:dicarboxylate symporter family transporter [Slackia sp.]